MNQTRISWQVTATDFDLIAEGRFEGEESLPEYRIKSFRFLDDQVEDMLFLVVNGCIRGGNFYFIEFSIDRHVFTTRAFVNLNLTKDLTESNPVL